MQAKTLIEAVKSDWIRRKVAARAVKIDLSSYAIAAMTGGAVSEDAVRRYITGRTAINSTALAHVLSVLGLTIAVK